MKKLVVVIALVFLTAVANGHRSTVVSFPGGEEAVSPNGRFVVVNEDSDAEPHHTLFLVDRSTKTKRKLLGYGRHVEVLGIRTANLLP